MISDLVVAESSSFRPFHLRIGVAFSGSDVPCRSVGAMFVHKSELRYFDCERASQLTWDATILEACPLFSRKFGPKTAHLATDLLTSCEPYLGIAPQQGCDLWM